MIRPLILIFLIACGDKPPAASSIDICADVPHSNEMLAVSTLVPLESRSVHTVKWKWSQQHQAYCMTRYSRPKHAYIVHIDVRSADASTLSVHHTVDGEPRITTVTPDSDGWARIPLGFGRTMTPIYTDE